MIILTIPTNIHPYPQVGVSGCLGSTMTDVAVESLEITVGSGEVIFDDGASAKDMTSQLDMLLPVISADVPPLINNALAASLAQSNETCAHNGIAPVSNDDIASAELDPAWEWELGNIVFGAILVLVCFMNLHHYFHSLVKKGDEMLEENEESYMQLRDGMGLDCARTANVSDRTLRSDASSVSHGDSLGAASTLVDLKRQLLRGAEPDRSVLNNPLIPWWLRYGMVLAIVATMYIFLSSNLDEEAVTVRANVRVGGTAIPPIDAFNFRYEIMIALVSLSLP